MDLNNKSQTLFYEEENLNKFYINDTPKNLQNYHHKDNKQNRYYKIVLIDLSLLISLYSFDDSNL